MEIFTDKIPDFTHSPRKKGFNGGPGFLEMLVLEFKL
jgi:hypothetical protein